MKRILLLLLINLLCIAKSLAADLQITIKDQNNEPVTNVVVKLVAMNHKVKLVPDEQIIDQIDKEYVPQVVVVIKGGNVSFPNKDNIKHHVYSFSQAKQFELPLYEGTPANPVSFEKEGVVVLGCNIHDWMRGYIYVSDSPYVLIGDEQGQVKFSNLPQDSYLVSIWHPQIKSSFETVKISLTQEQSIKEGYQIELKPLVKIRRPKARRSRRYN